MQPLDEARLRDVVEAAREAMRIVDAIPYATYEREKTYQWAVERGIEVIGEAARGVSKPFRDATPEIPRRPVIAQRHILAHDYGEILNERIWRVATIHVPALLAQIESLLPPESP